MAAQTAVLQEPDAINGVSVALLRDTIRDIETDADCANMQFRAANRWIDGGINRSTIKDFYGGGEKDDSRVQGFVVDADEPLPLAGRDTAPNPVEFVLHGLLACLTTTVVYHAALNDVRLEAIESEAEGDLDARGVLGLSDDVRKGYHHVRVTIRVKGEASTERLRQFAQYSPVYDIVSKSLPVDLVIERG